MGNSKIPWLKNKDGSPGKTWPLAEGCTPASSGCAHCAAKSIHDRFHPDQPFSEIRIKPGHLEDPLHWKKPQMILVDFMFDLFHAQMVDKYPDYLNRIFSVMAATPQHTYLVLSKRPKEMYQYLINDRRSFHIEAELDIMSYSLQWHTPDFDWPLPNVWLLVSVEDQETANERIPWLLKTPAAVRGVSYEPALGHIRFADVPGLNRIGKGPGIDLVFMGCESGRGARSADMTIEMARSTRDQCQSAGVKFYLKQMFVDGKIVHMPTLDGVVWDQIPEPSHA